MSKAIVYSGAGWMQGTVDSAIVLNVHEINTLYRQKIRAMLWTCSIRTDWPHPRRLNRNRSDVRLKR
ncbi:hypothetical protein CIAM_16710 [Citrobacter amalonaticus]|nr:hypothetical protein CIAM_16710 [Citrobacter amalonaticus]